MLSWHHLRFWAHDKRWKMSEFRTAQGNHWPSATWLLQNAAAEGLMLDGAALTPLLDCQWLRSEILWLSFHMLASFPIIDPFMVMILFWCSHGARLQWMRRSNIETDHVSQEVFSHAAGQVQFSDVFQFTVWEVKKLEISRNPFCTSLVFPCYSWLTLWL